MKLLYGFVECDRCHEKATFTFRDDSTSRIERLCDSCAKRLAEMDADIVCKHIFMD